MLEPMTSLTIKCTLKTLSALLNLKQDHVKPLQIIDYCFEI